MSDLSSHSSSTHSYDPAAIEARLNALVGNNDGEPKDVHSEAPDLEQQFLADPSLTWLGSRSQHGDQQVVIEYHRMPAMPNQTRLVLHLRFQPDLPTAPHVEANLIDIAGRTRITNCTAFGARIEITLARPNPESSSVCLEAICSSEPKTTEPTSAD
jgi:hypothetical protein